VATNAPALPFLPDWLYRVIFPQPAGVGLSGLGEAAVRAMYDQGVLVDITHMSNQSLTDTFALLDELDRDRRRPLVASHIACRLGPLAYNLDDDTIARVAERGGVLGVIDCRHYITDRRGPNARDRTLEASIDLICEHIDRIVAVTGTFDHAAIGTDLDGYIKPALTGLEHAGRLGDLQAGLQARYGADDAGKICSDNALRVLRTRFA
jgi:microsomal dipeptidase-like Zn-dependent dipeptidase